MMKNIIKSFAVIAAILSFSACQKEMENPIEKTRQTHTVTFVAGNPETKTAANINNEQGVVDYVWKDTDAYEEKFHVFENGEPALSITPSLNDGIMSISAEFDGEPSGTAKYTGYFNSGVQAVQSASGTDYDQLSDVLIAKETTEINDGVIHFQFKRLGAVCEVNLKGLTGTNLKTVKIESLDENVFLAGSLVDGELVGDSKVITVNCNNAITNGVGTLRFISMPIENANLRFIVETTDGGEAVAAKYVKTLNKPITFTRGDLKAFNVSSFSQVTTTVTFSENKVAGEGIYTAEGEDIPFPEVENVDANNVFVGWTKNEEYSAETKPTDMCTEAKMGAESVIYYAVYASISPATINPDEIVKLDASSTFAAGDNIAVFAKADDVYYGMYQETVSTSYVNYFTLNQEPVATDFKDAKKSWTLSAAEDEGKWYLGDATNGYLYNSSNNLYAKTEGDKSSLTIAWNENKEAFYIKNGDRWIACRAELTGDNQYKYRGGGNSGSPTSGSLAFFDIYKLLKYNGYNTYIDLRPIPTLTWSEGTAEARINAQNTFPSLTTDPTGLTVSYSSSDETVATINNPTDITLKKAGETTITATFEGNNQYKSASASYTLTVLPEATKNTVKFSINGVIDDTKTKEYTSGETIAFPEAPEVGGVVFKGWLTNPISGVLDSAPEGLITDTDNVTMGDADVTYYAVFATETTMPVKEEKTQTLQYDTWTYSGSTTNKDSYRLFHKDSYIESAAFDLSKLSKVVVYGGTFGGSSYNSLTIGDGTNTWKSVAVSGSSQTGVNEYAGGTALSGTGKLRITCNSGSASGSGVRISKVEIYTKKGGTTYSDYCTTVVTLNSIAVKTAPEKVIYTEGEQFDPTGLEITRTYSDGSSNDFTYASHESDFNFEPSTSTALTTEITSVNITYGGKSVSQVITVNETPALETMDDIFSVATEAGSTATDIKVNFTGCVVTGVMGDNAYITDNNGKGLIIYASNHGFVAGDILNGTVNCKVQLYNGSSELTDLKSQTEGLTVTKGGVATPKAISISDLSGVNTGAVITFESLWYNGSSFSDGTNTIKPYGTFITLPPLSTGRNYQVNGVYIQYGSTKEIAPRTEEDFVLLTTPYLNAEADKTNVSAAGEIVTITVDTNVEGWTVESDNAAFTVGAKSGNTVPVTVSENTSTTDGRTAKITVSASGVPDVEINLSQQKAGGEVKTTKLTNAQITAGTGGESYGDCSAIDENGFTYLAYAMKKYHSKATAEYYHWQIKKYASNVAYYVKLPEFSGNIKTIKLTVSSSSQPMTGGGNTSTLYFSSSKSTSATGTGVVSGTGASSITIDASSLNLKTGYITASGAIRIWEIEIEYAE